MRTTIEWISAKERLPEKEGAFFYLTHNGKIGVRSGKIDDWFVMKYAVVAWADQPDKTDLLIFLTTGL